VTQEPIATPEQREGERRAPDRRERIPRRAEDRRQRLRDMAALLFAICGGLVVIYVFFALFGAFDPGDAVVASLVAVGLGAVWFVGYWQRLRTGAARIQRADRERRGF
jgi:hypothetical protein